MYRFVHDKTKTSIFFVALTLTFFTAFRAVISFGELSRITPLDRNGFAGTLNYECSLRFEELENEEEVAHQLVQLRTELESLFERERTRACFYTNSAENWRGLKEGLDVNRVFSGLWPNELISGNYPTSTEINTLSECYCYVSEGIESSCRDGIIVINGVPYTVNGVFRRTGSIEPAERVVLFSKELLCEELEELSNGDFFYISVGLSDLNDEEEIDKAISDILNTYGKTSQISGTVSYLLQLRKEQLLIREAILSATLLVYMTISIMFSYLWNKSRRREMAICKAFGMGCGRLLLHMMIEVTVLAGAAFVCGMFIFLVYALTVHLPIVGNIILMAALILVFYGVLIMGILGLNIYGIRKVLPVHGIREESK